LANEYIDRYAKPNKRGCHEERQLSARLLPKWRGSRCPLVPSDGSSIRYDTSSEHAPHGGRLIPAQIVRDRDPVSEEHAVSDARRMAPPIGSGVNSPAAAADAINESGV
jgi:hypothetical protein